MLKNYTTELILHILIVHARVYSPNWVPITNLLGTTKTKTFKPTYCLENKQEQSHNVNEPHNYLLVSLMTILKKKIKTRTKIKPRTKRPMNCFRGQQHLNWNSAEEEIVLANLGGGWQGQRWGVWRPSDEPEARTGEKLVWPCQAERESTQPTLSVQAASCQCYIRI